MEMRLTINSDLESVVIEIPLQAIIIEHSAPVLSRVCQLHFLQEQIHSPVQVEGLRGITGSLRGQVPRHRVLTTVGSASSSLEQKRELRSNELNKYL